MQIDHPATFAEPPRRIHIATPHSRMPPIAAHSRCILEIDQCGESTGQGDSHCAHLSWLLREAERGDGDGDGAVGAHATHTCRRAGPAVRGGSIIEEMDTV